MIRYGTLFCQADGSKRSGYYEDHPREDHKFVLHGTPEEGTLLLPLILRVSKISETTLESVRKESLRQEPGTESGDWVFYTRFSRYILREYRKELESIKTELFYK